MATIIDSIGRVLAGRYRIESALGSGASANVFAAWDVTLQRRVAVKVLHPALATDRAFLRRFRAEAQSAAALAHPNVMAVHDWGEDEDGPFLVLEFVGGGSLRDLLDHDQRLTIPQAVSVGLQGANALAYAHGRGFVHRDIKPANLLFGEEGRLRVADFGLARALAEAAWTEPAGAAVGTARYSAPEQHEGGRVDDRADVYSLALVLYEAVTGVVPFASDTTVGTIMARYGKRLPGHDALGPLSPILDAAAAPDADRRISAAELADHLQQLSVDLDEPAPLPLAGVGGLGVLHVDDLTDHGANLDPQLFDAEAGGPTILGRQALHRARMAERGVTIKVGRRWPIKIITFVTLGALILAGAAYAAVKTKAFVPSSKVPAVVGLTTFQARHALLKGQFGLEVVRYRSSMTVPAGQILREIPGPGTSEKNGFVVQAVMSSGPPPVPVPFIANITGDCPAVTTVLQAAQLQISCSDLLSTTVPKGSVIDWNPKNQAPQGSVITVTISAGPPMSTIPSLSGDTCAGATSALKAAGLETQCNNEYSTAVTNGDVIDWSPTGTAPTGSSVKVDISQGPPPVIVPNVVGDSVSAAVDKLQSAGLFVGYIHGPYSGRVTSTSPAAGSSVSAGTSVDLYSK